VVLVAANMQKRKVHRFTDSKYHQKRLAGDGRKRD